MKTRTFCSLAFVAALLMSGVSYAQTGELSTKLAEARISVGNKADANGYVRIRLTPDGGQTIDVTVDVLERMNENEIAADIEKALIVAAGNTYNVEVSGGENVVIRKADRDTGPDFELEIAFNTPGLSITMHE